MATSAATKRSVPEKGSGSSDFVVPVIHVRLPESVVKVGFYGGLTAAIVAGAIDLPLALLAGVGVAIVRHRRA